MQRKEGTGVRGGEAEMNLTLGEIDLSLIVRRLVTFNNSHFAHVMHYS